MFSDICNTKRKFILINWIQENDYYNMYKNPQIITDIDTSPFSFCQNYAKLEDCQASLMDEF